MAKTNVHQEAHKRREGLKISILGHNKRIAEQRKIIKDAKKAIKQHQLLKKQSRTQFKITELELAN